MIDICFGCKHIGGYCNTCNECISGEMYEETVITNADGIRSMTDEELAELLKDAVNYFNVEEDYILIDKHGKHHTCFEYISKWLKEEMKI